MMKNKVLLGLIGVLALVGWANAATLRVPTEYPTVTAALAAADPGDTIEVAATYDSADAGEVFPITVTKDDISIICEEGAIFRVPSSSAGFVFYKVEGGALKYAKITSEDADTLGDVGVLIKESSGVVVEGNVIHDLLSGIRLILASGNTVRDNELYNIGRVVDGKRTGIGIFLEKSDGNTLSENEVYDSGEGLFLFESHNNTVLGDDYYDNDQMGVNLNDSDENTLEDLYVADNGTWGVRFMFADGNVLRDSEIARNALGGVELAASEENEIRDNYIHDNGTSTQDDNIQVVVTGGDKVLFTVPAFKPEEPVGPIGQIRAKKEVVEWKVGLLEAWIEDIDEEFIEIIQKIDIAYGGLLQSPPQTMSAIRWIEDAIAEKECIQTGSNTIADLDKCTPGCLLEDPHYNFSLEGAGAYFDQQIDDLWVAKNATGTGVIKELIDGWYLVTGDYTGTKYPLTRMKEFVVAAVTEGIISTPSNLDEIMEGEEKDFPLPPGAESLTKVAIVKVILKAIGLEIEEIIREINKAEESGILGVDEAADLKDKLTVIKDLYVTKIDSAVQTVSTTLEDVDKELDEAKNHINSGDIRDAQMDLEAARAKLQEAAAEKAEIYYWIGWIELKLREVNEELPKDKVFNGEIIGKKEQAGKAITGPEGEGDGEDVAHWDGSKWVSDGTDIGDKVIELLGRLNADEEAKKLLKATAGDTEFKPKHIHFVHVGFTDSTGNLIAGNVITTTVVSNALNIGIKLESPGNKVVNNVFTNDDLEHGRAGFYGTLDRAIEMLSSGNLVAYNLIEWVNIGIVRGGKEDRKDVQQEYLFLKLAAAEKQNGKLVTAIAVLEKKSEEINVEVDIVVKNNRIALNLFDHCGIGIEVKRAESNRIDENLFYECTDGGILFRTTAGPHIVIEHNDFVGGLSVVNEGQSDRDARDNFALNSPTSGPVIEPAAEEPFCYDNFGKIDKFEELGIEEFFNAAHPTFPPKAQGSDLRRLVVAGKVFILPEEKPRVCDDIFGEQPVPPTGECIDLPAGWNLISMWIEPEDPTPEAVFDEVPGILYLYRWDPDIEGWLTAHEGTLTQVSVLGGYWLWLPEPTTICVTGTEVTGDQEIPLGKAGWQMIGVPYPVAWGDVVGVGSIRVRNGAEVRTLAEAVAAGWLYHTVWEYDTAAGEWITTTLAEGTTLVPEKGYYIYTYVDNLTLLLSEMPTPGPIPTPTLALMGEEDLGTPPAPVVPASEATLEIANFPNPITDVHTTTFKVLGPMASQVEEMRVRIFDLAGRLVWEGEAYGPEVVWHTENLAGQYLANGVYLYQVQVKVGGTWITTSLKKLAIYR